MLFSVAWVNLKKGKYPVALMKAISFMDILNQQGSLDMKKFVRVLMLATMVSFVFVTLIPFINGYGCNSVFKAEEPTLGNFYGKCEFGQITATIINDETHEKYHLKGQFGMIGERYFIIGTPYDGSDNERPSALKINRYYRTVYSGFLIQGERTFMLSSSPYPVIREITIDGRVSFF